MTRLPGIFGNPNLWCCLATIALAVIRLNGVRPDDPFPVIHHP